MPLLHIAIVFLLGGIFFCTLFLLIRNGMLRERYALLWFCITVCVFCIPFLYDFAERLWIHFSFPSPTVTLMMFTLFLFMLICLQLSVSVSHGWRHKKILMQEITFLKLRMQEIERSLKEKNEYI